MDRFVKRMEYIAHMFVPYSFSYVYVLVCIPEASLELVKRRTLRKSFSIWLMLPPPIRAALWAGTRKLYRYVAVEVPQK